jgi:hypothetical protein
MHAFEHLSEHPSKHYTASYMPLVNQGLQAALLVQNVSNNCLEGATCLTTSIHSGNNFRFIAMQHPT